MYRLWFGRVLAFDGILPLVIWFAPWLVSIVLPNRPGVIEVLSVFLPVMGFLIRYITGRSLIRANECSPPFRLVQNVLLGLGLVLLALIDCVVVLIYVMPRGALLKPDDWLVMAGLGTVYFMLMAGAMFPGHRR